MVGGIHRTGRLFLFLTTACIFLSQTKISKADFFGECGIKSDDIDNIKRPVQVELNVTNKDQLHIIDLLWSEYSENIENIEINSERDKNKSGFIVKYGNERLNKFLADNKINLLITAHQFVKEGFTTFNNDRLLTVFSATNYMDKYKNIGGMINIAKKRANKRMNIIPKLITINNDNKNMYRNNRSPSPIRK